MKWARGAGLNAVDLKEAFSSSDAAIRYSGVSEVGTLWESLRTKSTGIKHALALVKQEKREEQAREIKVSTVSADKCISSVAKQSRPFKGPPKKRRHESLDRDKVLKMEAMTVLVQIAMQWTTWSFSQQFESMPKERRLGWLERFTKELSEQFDARYLLGVGRVWQQWVQWCSAAGNGATAVSAGAPWQGAVQEFLYSCSPTGQLAQSAPRFRFFGLRFMYTHFGGPQILDSQRPRISTVGAPVEDDSGAVALIPELQFQLELLLPKLVRLQEHSLVRAVVYSLVLSMGALRFQHAQRSMLVALTTVVIVGACLKGKGQPGYMWYCPRYSPTGFDVGLAIWSWYHDSSAVSRQYLFVHVNGGAWALAEHIQAIRHVLLRWIGVPVEAVALFSSYSLRRVAPTAAGIMQFDRLEALAVGNWRGAAGDMPSRYFGNKSALAKQVKMTIVLLYRAVARQQALRPITWEVLRAFATESQVKLVRQEALALLSRDKEEKATEACKLKGLVAPRRQFTVQGVKLKRISVPEVEARKDAAQDGSHAALHLGKERTLQPELPQKEEALYWLVTRKKGEPVVHVLIDGHPVCKRRQQAAKAKPFRRPEAMGDTAESLQGLGMPLKAKCERCWSLLDPAHRDLLARALVT